MSWRTGGDQGIERLATSAQRPRGKCHAGRCVNAATTILRHQPEPVRPRATRVFNDVVGGGERVQIFEEIRGYIKPAHGLCTPALSPRNQKWICKLPTNWSRERWPQFLSLDVSRMVEPHYGRRSVIGAIRLQISESD